MPTLTRSRATEAVVDIPTEVRPSQSLPARSTQTYQKNRPPKRRSSGRSSAFLATWVGMGMGAVLVFILIGQFVAGWVTNELNQWRYGYPRTYQTNAYVGHDESAGHPSHFLATNNDGLIEVIEFPGNDAAHARIFLGPQLSGPDADQVPVTLQFVDLQHNHHPDMLVLVNGTTFLYENAQGTFQLHQG